MSKFGKYVIVEVLGCKLPILFSPIISHDDITKGMKVLSAGFFDVVDGHVSVFGKSVMLELCSRPGDAVLIEKLLKGEMIT